MRGEIIGADGHQFVRNTGKRGRDAPVLQRALQWRVGDIEAESLFRRGKPIARARMGVSQPDLAAPESLLQLRAESQRPVPMCVADLDHLAERGGPAVGDRGSVLVEPAVEDAAGLARRRAGRSLK